jgi:hypothetical protein
VNHRAITCVLLSAVIDSALFATNPGNPHHHNHRLAIFITRQTSLNLQMAR